MPIEKGDGTPASVDPNEDVNPANSSEAEDGQQEVNTPTDENIEAGASSDAGEDGKSAAESSPADKGEKKPESILDAVTAAVKEEGQAEKSPDSEGGSEKDKTKSASEEDTDESADDGSGELSEKELEALKPKTRKRMEFLSGQLGEIRPKAEAMDHLVRYVGEAGLNTEEVNKGFEIMRLMKADPFAALEQLRPYVNALMQSTGDALPADLQEQVNQGHISEAYARTLVQQHTRTQLAQNAADRATEEAETLRTNQEQTSVVNDVANAVSDWERAWAASDPDYKAKLGRVQEKIELGIMRMQTAGEALNKDALVQLAQNSRQQVEEELKGFLPRKKPIDPLPDGQGSAPATRQPSTMQEAMWGAINGS